MAPDASVRPELVKGRMQAAAPASVHASTRSARTGNDLDGSAEGHAGMNKGFLLVLMQPPPTLEEEFNAWYDTEHIAERLAVPGFETALRYVCIDGAPRYLAMYDLASPEVLSSPAYLKVGFENASPWTKREI